MGTKRIIIIFWSVILTLGGAAQSEHLRLAKEISVGLPMQWGLVSDSSNYPFRFASSDSLAELIVFKSVLPSNEAIQSPDELRGAVESVIEEVLPELADPVLLRSSGYAESDRASFILDFTTADTTQTARFFHRLKGVLYRQSNNSQLLFTLWAKASVDNFPYYEPAIDLIQTEFEFIGSREQTVFAPGFYPRYWLLALAAVFIVGLVYYSARYRSQRFRKSFADTESFWRCECGRLNSRTREKCRRCGRERLQTEQA